MPMDNTQNQNEPQITPIENPPKPPEPVVVQVDPPKPKKKRSTLAITTAFMAGALTYAIAAGAYNFYFQTQENDILRAQAEAKSQTVTNPIDALAQNPPSQTNNTSIPEEDIKNYVQVVDCTTKPGFVAYKSVIDKGSVGSINLYDGMRVSVANAGSSRTYTVQWKALPKVVDYKCDELAISKITTDTRVNIYVDKEAASTVMIIPDARVIQKATK